MILKEHMASNCIAPALACSDALCSRYRPLRDADRLKDDPEARAISRDELLALCYWHHAFEGLESVVTATRAVTMVLV